MFEQFINPDRFLDLELSLQAVPGLPYVPRLCQGMSPTSVRIRPIALFGISCQKSETAIRDLRACVALVITFLLEHGALCSGRCQVPRIGIPTRAPGNPHRRSDAVQSSHPTPDSRRNFDLNSEIRMPTLSLPSVTNIWIPGVAATCPNPADYHRSR